MPPAAMRVRRLKERQHLVELAEEMAGVGYWRIDAATREHTWSPQIARIYGLDPDRLDEEQIHPGQFYHPDDRATARAATSTTTDHTPTPAVTPGAERRG